MRANEINPGGKPAPKLVVRGAKEVSDQHPVRVFRDSPWSIAAIIYQTCMWMTAFAVPPIGALIWQRRTR